MTGETAVRRWTNDDVLRVLYHVVRTHEQAHAHLGGDSELLVDAVRIARETLIDQEWWPEDDRDLPERRLRLVDGRLVITAPPPERHVPEDIKTDEDEFALAALRHASKQPWWRVSRRRIWLRHAMKAAVLSGRTDAAVES